MSIFVSSSFILARNIKISFPVLFWKLTKKKNNHKKKKKKHHAGSVKSSLPSFPQCYLDCGATSSLGQEQMYLFCLAYTRQGILLCEILTPQWQGRMAAYKPFSPAASASNSSNVQAKLGNCQAVSAHCSRKRFSGASLWHGNYSPGKNITTGLTSVRTKRAGLLFLPSLSTWIHSYRAISFVTWERRTYLWSIWEVHTH